MMNKLPKQIRNLLFTFLLAVVLTVAGAYIYSDQLRSIIRTSIIDSDLVILTNENRDDAGLETLTVNPLLQQAAQAKALDMAAKGYFSHTTPEGKRFTEWLSEAGYDYLYAGENLAVKFNQSKSVTDAWMRSPKHRANLLSPNFTEIGIGLAEGTYKGNKTTFVVQMFGSPKLPLVLSTVKESVIAEGEWKDSVSEEKSMVVATKNNINFDLIGNDLVRPLLLSFLPFQ